MLVWYLPLPDAMETVTAAVPGTTGNASNRRPSRRNCQTHHVCAFSMSAHGTVRTLIGRPTQRRHSYSRAAGGSQASLPAGMGHQTRAAFGPPELRLAGILVRRARSSWRPDPTVPPCASAIVRARRSSQKIGFAGGAVRSCTKPSVVQIAPLSRSAGHTLISTAEIPRRKRVGGSNPIEAPRDMQRLFRGSATSVPLGSRRYPRP